MGNGIAPAPAAAPAQENLIVNDFAIVVATANGTGSQTANLAILRALFKMGIPVNGKNIFPSNIQGLPTWYHIRLSADGYTGRRHTSELLLAFNQATFVQDVQTLPAGGICLYNADWRAAPQRDDITAYAIPVNEFIRDSGTTGKLKDSLANMVYVGALTALRDMDMDVIKTVVADQLQLEADLRRTGLFLDLLVDEPLQHHLRGVVVFGLRERVEGVDRSRHLLLVTERRLEHRDRRIAVSYTHLRAHETVLDLVCRLLLEKKKTNTSTNIAPSTITRHIQRL